MCGPSQIWKFMSRIEALRLPIQECATWGVCGPVQVVSEPS